MFSARVSEEETYSHIDTGVPAATLFTGQGLLNLPSARRHVGLSAGNSAKTCVFILDSVENLQNFTKSAIGYSFSSCTYNFEPNVLINVLKYSLYKHLPVCMGFKHGKS